MSEPKQSKGLPLPVLDRPSESQARSRWTRDQVVAVILWIATSLVAGILAWILIDILGRGLSEVSFAYLFSEPADAGRSGGIGTIIFSTLLILAVALFVSVPLSLASAVVLARQTSKQSKLGQAIRRCLDVLAAVPSIVFGLFGNAFFCIALNMGYSIMAGGLTLACMVLPIMIRTTEQAIRAVPDAYGYAAASLGLSQSTTLFQVILPAAAPALGAGLILGIGRAMAETAALIFTAGYVTRHPESLFDSGRALSVHIFDMAMNVPGGNSRAYAAAAVLILLLLMINAVAIGLTRLASADSVEPNLMTKWK